MFCLFSGTIHQTFQTQHVQEIYDATFTVNLCCIWSNFLDPVPIDIKTYTNPRHSQGNRDINVLYN
jgi:hypothetical protein